MTEAMNFATWGSFPDSVWAPLGGGVLIGLAAVILMAVNGRIAGISGIVSRLLPPTALDSEWIGRGLFVLGLIAGPLLWGGLAGGVDLWTPEVKTPVLVLAGLLVGFGAVLGSGCTSGHGVCGLARLSPRSLVAVLAFMASAAVTVFVVRHVLGN